MLTVPGGYLDLQINGGWGHHFSNDPASIWQVGTRLVEHGVTQFVPTLVSDGFDRLDDAIAVLEAGPPAGWVGAEPVGLHLEGPWLSPHRAGAHRIDALRSPDPSEVRGRGWVRIVTLAPELPGATAAIEQLSRSGIVVSLGHSEASAAEASRAIDAGASMGTHLFNAMSGLHHRSPGLAAALLLDSRASFGIIADGEHVAPDMVRLAWSAAPDRLLLVSDAVAALGSTDQPVARLVNGTLAGAVVAIDEGVRNLVDFCGCPLADAARAASSRPRAALAIDHSDDTFIELDERGTVARTVIDGSVVFERSGSTGRGVRSGRPSE
jgi:N-acetylglucosamine-6-phosphate deacetylase